MKHSQSNTQPIILTDTQIFYEDDCACPSTESVKAPVQSFTNRLYRQAENIYEDALPQNFRLAFSPYAPQGPSALNIPAWERWQNFCQPQPLTQPTDHILAQQNLILPQDVPIQTPRPIPETLTVWMHVTNACNLDCPYCYVRKSSESMNETIGLNSVEKIFSTALKQKFKGVKLKYAGGEAILYFRLIKRLSERAHELSKESNLELQQVILSNGTRIRGEEVAWMLENGVKLMISLDGIEQTHDRMRPYRNGKGSFQTVSQTIDKILLPAGLVPMITITVTRENAGGIADATRWALDRDLPVSLNFYRHKPGSREDLAAEETALIEGMLAAYQVFEEILPTRPFLNGLLDRAQVGSHVHACGVGSSYLVINHRGALSQCQMLLEDPISHIPTSDLLLQVQNGPIQNLSVEQKEICNQCIYRYRCAGGCPLETYRASGRWDAPSPNFRIYQTLFPYALRLEGLRLLKKHNCLQ